jgi:hypothetical protein
MLEQDNRDQAESTNAFQVVSLQDGLGVAEAGSVCMVVWHAAVTSDRFIRQKHALDDVVRRYPLRAGLLCVVESCAPVPEPAMREASAKMVASYGDRLRCVACVIEASGFRGAITRSVLSGMALLISHGLEVKFTGTVAAAAPWIAGRCLGVSAVTLLEGSEHLRFRLSHAPS